MPYQWSLSLSRQSIFPIFWHLLLYSICQSFVIANRIMLLTPQNWIFPNFHSTLTISVSFRLYLQVHASVMAILVGVVSLRHLRYYLTFYAKPFLNALSFSTNICIAHGKRSSVSAIDPKTVQPRTPPDQWTLFKAMANDKVTDKHTIFEWN